MTIIKHGVEEACFERATVTAQSTRILDGGHPLIRQTHDSAKLDKGVQRRSLEPELAKESFCCVCSRKR
jgi:hypothetical protein